MAGNSNPQKAPWPHNEDLYEVTLGPAIQPVNPDTAGFITFDIWQIPFDCTVASAFVTASEMTITGGVQLKIVDDSSPVQTIVAAVSLTNATHEAKSVALTVADSGPLLTSGQLSLQLDGNASDVYRGVKVTLFVKPKFS